MTKHSERRFLDELPLRRRRGLITPDLEPDRELGRPDKLRERPVPKAVQLTPGQVKFMRSVVEKTSKYGRDYQGIRSLETQARLRMEKEGAGGAALEALMAIAMDKSGHEEIVGVARHSLINLSANPKLLEEMKRRARKFAGGEERLMMDILAE